MLAVITFSAMSFSQNLNKQPRASCTSQWLVCPDSAEAPPSFLKSKHSAVAQVGDGAVNSESGEELGPRLE